MYMSSVLFIVDCGLQSSYLEGGVGDMDFHMQQCHNVYMYVAVFHWTLIF